MNFNLRGSALRCAIVTPLGPNKTMIEFRGLGLKKDTPEERQIRINRSAANPDQPFVEALHMIAAAAAE